MAVPTTQIIRSIIEEAIEEDGFVFKTYVLNRIKVKIHPTDLTSKIRTYNPEGRSDIPTDDPDRTLQLAAEKAYRDSIRSSGLANYFDFLKDGRIVRKKKKEEKKDRKKGRTLSFRGKDLTVIEAANIVGVKNPSIYHRLRMGWDDEKILTTPAKPKKLLDNDEDCQVILMGLISTDWLEASKLYKSYIAELKYPENKHNFWPSLSELTLKESLEKKELSGKCFFKRK